MKKYLSLLKIQSCFRGSARMNLRPCWTVLSAVTRDYHKGEYVFSRESALTVWRCFLEGCIHIQKEDYWGNLSILSEITEGEIFGEVYACLGSDELLNNAVAVKPSKVLFLDVKRILTMCPSACQFHGRLIRNLLTVLAQKNKMLTQKLEHMSRRTTREKLLSYLSEQSQRAAGVRYLTFHLTGSSSRIFSPWTERHVCRAVQDER